MKAAIRWTRARGNELSIDARRIAVLGRSAGAHLALIAAGTAGLGDFEGGGGNQGISTAVGAVVAIFPPTLFFTGEQRTHGGTPARALLGETATEEAARLAGPLSHVGPAFAPTLPLALALLLARAALSQMDVPTRSSYVMAVVTPTERPAAASFTSVPRSLAAAASPALAGALFAASFQALPLLVCGGLKIAYDLLLLAQFRSLKPPEEL